MDNSNTYSVIEDLAAEMLHECAIAGTLDHLAAAVTSFSLDADAVLIFAQCWAERPREPEFASAFVSSNLCNPSITSYLKFFTTPLKTIDVPWLSQNEWNDFTACYELKYQRKICTQI